MIDKTLSIVFGYKRVLLYYDEECTNEGDRRLTYEVLFVEYEVFFLQASVKLMHYVINVLFFLRSGANKVPACEYRSITSTLIYTHLVQFEDDEYNIGVAKTLKEDEELLKAGFEYVTDRDGVKIYRKRK